MLSGGSISRANCQRLLDQAARCRHRRPVHRTGTRKVDLSGSANGETRDGHPRRSRWNRQDTVGTRGCAATDRHVQWCGNCRARRGCSCGSGRVVDRLVLGVPESPAGPCWPCRQLPPHRRMLLIIDNFEHVVGPPTCLEQLITQRTDGMLVTSRGAAPHREPASRCRRGRLREPRQRRRVDGVRRRRTFRRPALARPGAT